MDELTLEDFLDCNENDGEKLLSIAIIYRAVQDYIELCKKKKTKIKSEGGDYSKNEITGFFHSEWGEIILALAGLNITGERIINHLRSYSPKTRLAAYSTDGERIGVFKNLSDGADFCGVKKENISACCSGKRKTAGGYVWKYI